MLIIVRHALPEIVPAAAPHDWVLGDQGRAGAKRLCDVLPSGAVLVASAEPKAWQTLESAGPVERDHRFNEVCRDGEPFGGNWRELRLAYVGGTAHPAWEPQAEVAARFEAGITDWLTSAAGRPLVVASHGMAMTSWLVSRGLLAEPGRWWAGLSLPDAYVVDLAGGAVDRLPGVTTEH